MRFLLVLAFVLGCTESAPPLLPGDAGMSDGAAGDAIVFDAGPDVAPDSSIDGGPTPEGLFVRVYDDEGADDRTRRFNGFEEGDGVRAGISVRAIGPAGSTEMVTGDDGIARFDSLPSGNYIFDTGETDATTHNVAPEVVRALDEGALRMVTFGDSLPVFGGQPRFDAVLAARLNMVTSVESVNIAVSGSTTREWGVDQAFYPTLEEEVAGTDLFIVSLGGNDFLAYVQNLFVTGGMAALIDALGGAAEEEALAILERVIVIIDSVRAMNPDADFVFLLYPNYPASNNWQTLIRNAAGPALADTAITLITSEFGNIMRALGDRLASERLVVVDLYRQTQAEDIDPFLVDELHFTQFGHRRVAEEIFLSIGGVTVGEPVLFQPYEVGLRP